MSTHQYAGKEQPVMITRSPICYSILIGDAFQDHSEIDDEDPISTEGKSLSDSVASKTPYSYAPRCGAVLV